MVEVQYKTQTCQVPLVVVSGQGPALFRRNWLSLIPLDWNEIQRTLICKITSKPLDELLLEYEDI